MRKLLVKAVLTLPTHGGVWSSLRTFERTQWLPKKQRDDLQLRRLKALLSHAYRTVPYYRSFNPKIFDIRSVEDLARLPILKRSDIRRSFGSLQSFDGPRGRLVMSAGSTGVPVCVRKPPLAVMMESAAQYRSYRWVGFDFGDRYGYIFAYRGIRTRIQNVIAEMLLPHISMDSLNIEKAKLSRFVRYLGSKPTVLIGSPLSFLILAKFIGEWRVYPRVKLAISVSDQLFPEERERLSSFFDTKVYDFYGSNEIGSIAAECQERVGHHVSSENVIVEVVAADGTPLSPGVVGSVLVTDLNNYSMPLIRYEIGDQSSSIDDECPCGRGLPLLGPIEGRLNDLIVTPDDRFIRLSTIGNRVLSKTHIEQFQIHQSSKHHVTVYLVLGREWREREGEFIRQAVQSVVGEEMKVMLEFHEAIATRPSGKRWLVRSDVMTPMSERMRS